MLLINVRLYYYHNNLNQFNENYNCRRIIISRSSSVGEQATMEEAVVVPDAPVPAVRRAPPRPAVLPLMSALLHPRPSAPPLVDSTTQTPEHPAAARAGGSAGAPPPDTRDSDEEHPRRFARRGSDEEQSPRRTLRFADNPRSPRYHRRRTAIDDPHPASRRELSPSSLGFRELGSGASMASDIMSKGVGRGGVPARWFSTPYDDAY